MYLGKLRSGMLLNVSSFSVLAENLDLPYLESNHQQGFWKVSLRLAWVLHVRIVFLMIKSFLELPVFDSKEECQGVWTMFHCMNNSACALSFGPIGFLVDVANLLHLTLVHGKPFLCWIFDT